MLKFLKLAQFSESFRSHLFFKSISKIHFTIYSFSCFASFVPCLVNDSAEVQSEVTQVKQYRPKRLPVGQRLSQCGNEGTVARMSWEVIDQANTNVKLLTLGALYIWKKRPEINTRNELRSWEQTLKLDFEKQNSGLYKNKKKSKNKNDIFRNCKLRRFKKLNLNSI